MGSSRRFYAWAPHLVGEFRVVRIDMRGHGGSGAPGPDQLSPQRLVQDVIELAEHLGVARTPVNVLARFVAMMRGFEVLDELHLVRCPTLAIAPGADPIHERSHYQVLAEKIPDCEFLVYEGLPHNITDTVPDRCARDYRRFLLAHRRE